MSPASARTNAGFMMAIFILLISATGYTCVNTSRQCELCRDTIHPRPSRREERNSEQKRKIVLHNATGKIALPQRRALDWEAPLVSCFALSRGGVATPFLFHSVSLGKRPAPIAGVKSGQNVTEDTGRQVWVIKHREKSVFRRKGEAYLMIICSCRTTRSRSSIVDPGFPGRELFKRAAGARLDDAQVW